MRALHKLGGHFWTISPSIREAVAPVVPPPSVAWETTVDDPAVGAVPIRGNLSEPDGAGVLVVIVHGLGGHNDRPYCREAAIAADGVGAASLRINVRGADRSGADLMHAGLTADIHATLASPEVARYERVVLVGFSIGGHLSLKAASEGLPANVVGVAGISAPLDLDGTVQGMDRRRATVYRASLIGGLNEIYAAWAEHNPNAMSPELVAEAKTLREWDRRVVIPRHGFDTPEHYYATQSVGPHLSRIEIPAVYVGSRVDPMVPEATVRPHLEAAPNIEAHLLDHGGHVNFSADLDVGLGPRPGVAAQVIDRLCQAG